MPDCDDLCAIKPERFKSSIDKYWYKNCLSDDIRIAKHIKELCIDRDAVDQRLMPRNEICDIIEYLCTV